MPCHAKVRQHTPKLSHVHPKEEDVARFEVSMDDVLGVQVFKAEC
jgi:hypothetical protein